MVHAVSAFLDFCYLVQHNVLNESTLDAIDDVLAHFHDNRVVFEEAGVWTDSFSLPRQHSMKHYCSLIQMFGAPNGLCSSITESKHIKAVKEPWRRSSKCDVLGQMLVTNQRLDKLSVSHVHLAAHGMLNGPCLAQHLVPLPVSPPLDHGDINIEAVDGPKVSASVSLAWTRGTRPSFKDISDN
jgi:hypothetical protein